MKNEFESWLKTNTTSGQAWTTRLLSLAAAGAATALVGLSVIVMAELGLPAGDSAMQARAPSAPPAPAQTIRYAQALQTVTVVGRREAGEPALGVPTTVALPAGAGSRDAAASIEIAGDNLRQ